MNKYNTYASKFDNFDEMEEFLKRCKLLNLIQVNIGNTNTAIKEKEFVMKYVLIKKTVGPDSGFNGEFYQIPRKK